MPDSQDIDNALVAKLGADAALLVQATNGAYYEQAPPDSTRYVLVSLVDEEDVQQFNGRSHENALYRVVMWGRSTPKTPLPAGVMKAGAARIDALLDGGTLTVAGYSLMTIQREARIRDNDVDEVDSSIHYEVRGGEYRVVMST